MSFALLFPGQGSHRPGMCREIFEVSAAARDVFSRASAALGRDTAALCFSGNAESLSSTAVAQPALFTAETAVLAALREAGIPDAACVAGHSLGEFSALHAAGSLGLEDGVRLVAERGRLMDEAGNGTRGGMAAVIGRSCAEIGAAITRAGLDGALWVANVNSDDQVVVSGSLDAVERFIAFSEGNGAKKVVRLRVAGAFHSPLMAGASAVFERVLDGVPFSDPSVPVVSNVLGSQVKSGAGVRAALRPHMTSPVRWAESVRCMAAAGVKAYVEVGPGTVLSGLVKKIDPKAVVSSVGRPGDVDRAARMLSDFR
ncbi:MAG: ACP S-malonyltransferase [Deltaproteobacteria bacterium]|nr:ACP S-malonyltransferase [Deltaproteobacteria bacterium]